MDKTFFTGNRRRLLAEMGEGDFVLLAFSGHAPRRSADEDYAFYANRNFAYLTGITQKNVVYLAWRRGTEQGETLFLPETDAMYERWHGRMMRPDAARTCSGIAQIEPRTALDDRVEELLGTMESPCLWLDIDPPAAEQGPETAQKYAASLREKHPDLEQKDMHPILSRLRTVKQPEEIEQLRRSIDITDAGIREIYRVCRPGMYEYQLRAAFEKVLADEGVREPAFSTIVAAGPSALVMHYPEQDRRIEDGHMVLLDLGAQYGFCGADISRVFPANGTFTDRQKQLHDASLSAIDYLCGAVKPGMAMADIDPMTREFLFPKLRAMGLAETEEDVKKYVWHRTSHHLGFDTHDVNDYTLPICPGMVFTMEVGIYVEDWGEGVRIEDDILITETGCENLSHHIPRTVEDIEALLAQR